MTITAFAPATAANFIIGFDVLGAALVDINNELFGDIVTIEENSELVITATGAYAHKLPADPSKNIIAACCDLFHKSLATRDCPPKKFIMRLEKRLPVASGLGSSAASIVAALVALNAFYAEPFNTQEILLFAGKMEGRISGSVHYDNVAPSLLGGLQLLISTNKQLTAKLPFFDDWFFVMYYPGIEVSTRRAREILPKSFDLRSITIYWQKLASFIHGLYQDDRDLVASLLHDDLIEPYRSKLVPEFERLHAIAKQAGALAFGLSGSGSSCLAIANSLETAQRIRAAIDHMASHPEAFSRICKLDMQGARIIK